MMFVSICAPVTLGRRSTQTPAATTSETSANASFGDLNGDGKPDIIAANRYGMTPDFNHDGKLDVVAIDDATGIAIYVGRGDGTADFIVGDVTAPSTVYFNDGTGKNFTRVSFGDSKGTAFGGTVGDVDKDGRPDIAVARSEAPNVLYFASGPAGRCK